MSGRLPSGVPRVYRSHHGQVGAWFREHFTALEDRFGPFTDTFTRHQAARVSERWCAYRTDVEDLEAAQNVRRNGKGRRPSVSAIARLKKRAALSESSYDATLRRLEDLTAKQRRQIDPLAAVRRAVTDANAPQPVTRPMKAARR